MESDYSRVNWRPLVSKYATSADACESYCMHHPAVLSALAAATARIEDLLASRAMDDAQFTKDRARIEKLERMVVWAVRHGAEFDDGRMWWFRLLSENSGPVDIEMENDSATSILAAVEKAMGEK